MLMLEFLIGHLILWFVPNNEDGNRLLRWWQNYCVDCIKNSNDFRKLRSNMVLEDIKEAKRVVEKNLPELRKKAIHPKDLIQNE